MVVSVFNIFFVLCTLGAVCGFASRHQLDSPHIVGGEDAKIEDFPYQISVRRFLNYWCGASIISKYYALSAAHCFHNRYWLIWYGINAGSNRLKQGKYHFIRSIVPHEKYEQSTTDYDIAVIRIWFGFSFNERIKPIRIVEANHVPRTGTNLIVTGWGRQSELDSSIPDILKKVNVTVVDHEECAKFYNFKLVSDRMFCAGHKEGGKDACNGDSGGPIVDLATVTQVGIISWGVGCGGAERPGVYTDLSHPLVKAFIGNNTK